MEKLPRAVAFLAAGIVRRVPLSRSAAAEAVADRHDAERDVRQRGQGLAEYALILAFIAIVAIAALIFFGEELFGVLSGQIGSQIGWVVDNMP